MGRIRDWLRGLDSVVVALSGGVDSAVLAHLAREELGDGALAVTVASEVVPARELDDARKVASAIGIAHEVVEVSDLADAGFAANMPDRCARCRRISARALWDAARRNGIGTVVDGNNASDAGDFRPGIDSATAEGIRHPFLEFGVTKDMIRAEARRSGLPVHSKPASACLASRIPYGTEITGPALRRVEAAEDILLEMGFARVRVRDHGTVARIELDADRLAELAAHPRRAWLVGRLRGLGYRFVALDLEGYSVGSLNRELDLGSPPAGGDRPEAATPKTFKNTLPFHHVGEIQMKTPVEVRNLKEGKYIVIDDEPCKIVEYSTSKPGKHGEAKARIVAVGMWSGTKKSIVHPVTHRLYMPEIDKRTAQVVAILGDEVQLMDMQSYEVFNIPIPEEFKGQLEPGKELQYTVALDRKMISKV